jgi:arsenite methyltransferase
MTDKTRPGRDPWVEWVLKECRITDPEQEQRFQRTQMEQVQQEFAIAKGEVLLDVGTGAGWIAFGALPLVGEQGRVIFSDVSQELLDHCRCRAQETGVLDRCRFLRASADDLSALEDASVDVVTVKAVLIFVAAKAQAFQEFYRVLKPNGRLYVEEPINRFRWPEPDHIFRGRDVTPIWEIVRKVRAVYTRIQPPDTDPMFDFDERDLVRLAEAAGFARIDLRLEAHVDHRSLVGIELGWEEFWRGTGNPRIPSLEEAARQALTPAETERLVACLRPKVEREPKTACHARTYLWATKEEKARVGATEDDSSFQPNKRYL